ncbi:MAG: penicillin-binding transpeptidase domain-containing protein [Bacteroidales bacterium]
MALYPPGSTFKPIIGLIGLQEGVLTENYEFFCNYGYFAPGVHVACHHFTSFSLADAISTSCNAYFCNAFRRIIENKKYGSTAESYSAWRSYLATCGFGSRLGIDLSNELRDLCPRHPIMTVIMVKTGESPYHTVACHRAGRAGDHSSPDG